MRAIYCVLIAIATCTACGDGLNACQTMHVDTLTIYRRSWGWSREAVLICDKRTP